MHDLCLLCDGDSFAVAPSVPTRIAMVHHSFRTVSVRRGIIRQQFAAHFPALGLLSIAHTIRVDAAGGLVPAPDLRYFDQEAYATEDELAGATAEWLRPSARRIILASSYTPTVDQLEAFLGRFDPSAYLIVVGGAHATLAPDVDNVHLVVRGEGGAALLEAVERFSLGGELRRPQLRTGAGELPHLIRATTTGVGTPAGMTPARRIGKRTLVLERQREEPARHSKPASAKLGKII